MCAQFDAIHSSDPTLGLLTDVGDFRPSFVDRVPIQHFRRLRNLWRFVMGLPLDPGVLSGTIQIFGVDEVIARMQITPVERNFLLTRWLKTRNDQKAKAHRHSRAFR